MRWAVFIIVAVVAAALETSKLVDLLTLHGIGALYPSVVGVVVVFVSLFAPRHAALWAAWLAGLLLDLAMVNERGFVIGPHALGFVFGAYFVLQVRTVVFRRRVLTIALLTLMFLAASGVVEVAILTLRSWIDQSSGFGPIIELLRRLGIALYSALLAVVVGWLLVQSMPLWGFQSSDRRLNWR